MKIFLDTCVFADMMLVRQREEDNRNALLILKIAANPKFEFCVSPMTVATSFYLLRKSENPASKISSCLKDIKIAPAAENDVRFSLVFDFPDREDAMQMSCACNSDCELILTRNPDHFTGGPLPVMSPEDFVKRLAFYRNLGAQPDVL